MNDDVEVLVSKYDRGVIPIKEPPRVNHSCLGLDQFHVQSRQSVCSNSALHLASEMTSPKSTLRTRMALRCNLKAKTIAAEWLARHDSPPEFGVNATFQAQ